MWKKEKKDVNMLENINKYKMFYCNPKTSFRGASGIGKTYLALKK